MSTKTTEKPLIDAVEEIIYDPSEQDDSRLGYFGTAQDPFIGAIIEPGWRYAVVSNDERLGINGLLEARRLGYTIAPATRTIRSMWDASQRWAVRCPQEMYDARKKEEDAAGEEQRSAMVPLGEGVEVVENTKGKTSLGEILNG